MSASRHLHRVTLVLVGISCALIQVALESRQPGVGLPLLGFSLLLAFLVPRLTGASDADAWTSRAVAGVLGVSLLPLAWDVATRSLALGGAPYEVQLACVLRNAMLALAVTPRLPRATGHAALGSFFLVVFGYLWSSGPWAMGLLVVYALLGTWWLLAAYWDRLGGRFADSSESALPLRPASMAVLALAATACLLVPLARHSATTTALAGFFPSSGGTQQSDPFAHGGVGDGDQLVGGKDNASSFGPVDTELFLESKMPSLYDAFNEFAQETPAKRKEFRRAIPLAPSQALANHQKTGTTQRATKEFSTVRQTTADRHNHDDRLSAALLAVKGRVPLHLALETYDRWDGRSLIASDSGERLRTRLLPKDSTGQRWLDLSRHHPARVFDNTAASQVRVLNLKTDRVPTPAGVKRVTLHGLHAASMFESTADGLLTMNGQRVPQLTIFEYRAALRDRGANLALAIGDVPDDPGRIASLAADWTESIPQGWPQVEAIVRRLQARCALDREAMIPDSAEDAVEHFLFESRRGPDYLFATSASLLLRSLGYDTRVRSGFYADPDRYRRASGLTWVLAEDAHFWVEIRTKGGRRVSFERETLPGVWVTVEPTPGFEVLYAPETPLAWLLRNAVASLKVLAANPVTSLTTAFALALVFVNRRRLLDGLLIGWWSIRARMSGVDGLARMTLRLFEWRAWAHRCGRPTGVSLGRWEAIHSQQEFVALAGWALYGPDSPAPMEAASARAVCGRAMRTPLGLPAQRQGGCPPLLSRDREATARTV